MDNFEYALLDHFGITDLDENSLLVDEDTMIFFAEDNLKITLLCPCFPVPGNHAELTELLALNCQGDTSFGAAQDIVLAKRVLDAEEAPAELAREVDSYIANIRDARQRFGYYQSSISPAALR